MKIKLLSPKCLKRIVDLASIGYLSSVIMDSYLWLAKGYMIPCWTIALMSAGFIILLQAIKRIQSSS